MIVHPFSSPCVLQVSLNCYLTQNDVLTDGRKFPEKVRVCMSCFTVRVTWCSPGMC